MAASIDLRSLGAGLAIGLIGAAAFWRFGTPNQAEAPDRKTVSVRVPREPERQTVPLFERRAADTESAFAAADSTGSDAPEAEPVETARPNARERTEVLQDDVRTEERDAAWSPASERYIAEVFSAPALRHGVLRDVQCGDRRCTFDIEEVPLADVDNDARAYVKDLHEQLSKHFHALSIWHGRAEDGQFSVKVIGARPGFTLRGRVAGGSEPG